MATLGLQTADFASVLKINYIDPLNDNVVRKHVLLNRLEKNSKDVSGSHAHVPIISARNPAVGSRKDTADGGPKLPAHGRQTYSHATFKMGLHYGRGLVSGPAMRASRDKEGAFAKALDTEMTGLSKSLPDDLNRQICGTGLGRAATLTGDHAASTLMSFDARANFQVRVGDRVTFADSGDGTTTLVQPATATTVVAVNYDTAANQHTVELDTVTGAQVDAANDALYFGSGAPATDEDLSIASDIYGIQTLVDDGNIMADEVNHAGELFETITGSITKVGGIIRADNQFWQSSVLANSAGNGILRTLTQTLIMQAHLTATAIHGAVANRIEGYCDPSMWGTLGMVQVGNRVYNDFKSKVEFGWEYIEVNGSKVFCDRDLPRHVIFFLNMDDIFLLTQGGYEFMDDDGNIVRAIAGGGRDSWEFSLRRDCQLGARSLRSHVKLKDCANTMTLTGSIH